MVKIRMVLCLLVISVVLLGTSCTSFGGKIIQETGALHLELVKWRYLSTEYEYDTSEWTASGGFFLLFGNFSAGGGSRHEFIQERDVVFAVELVSDGTILVLRVPARIIRLRRSQHAAVEIIPRDKFIQGTNSDLWADQPKISIVENLSREFIISLPLDEVDDYLRIALSDPLRTVKFGSN